MNFRKYIEETDRMLIAPVTGDDFDFQINESLSIECEVVEHTEDSYIIAVDNAAWKMLESAGIIAEGEMCTECGMGTMYTTEDHSMRCDECGYTTAPMTEASNHLHRAWDINPEYDIGNGYWVGVDTHEYDDNSKASFTLYHLENTEAANDKFAHAWREVGNLPISPYEQSADKIKAAAEFYARKDAVMHSARTAATDFSQISDKVGLESAEPVVENEDVVNHPVMGAVAAKNGRALYFASRDEAGAYAEKMAQKYPEKSKWMALGVIPSPMAGHYMVKMPESLLDEADDPDVKNLPPINATGDGNQARTNALAKMASSQPATAPAVTDTDRKKALQFEAEYHGHQVTLGKPSAGDVKKYKVFVKDPKTGNVKKVNFGDKHMSIKRDNPARRKNFRARHNCADKKDRTSAGYWSCRMWSKKPVSQILKGK